MADVFMFTVPYITYADVAAIDDINLEKAEDLENRNRQITFPASRIRFAMVEEFDTTSGKLVYANVFLDGMEYGVMVRKTPDLCDQLRQTVWRNMFGTED